MTEPYELRYATRERRWAAWRLRNRRWLLPVLAAALIASDAQVDWPLGLHLAAAVALVAALVVGPSGSRGVSMAPSLTPWTRGLLLGAPPLPIRRGDLVLAVPDGVVPIVKRVAGLPGDRLRFRGGAIERAEAGGWVEAGPALDTLQLDLGAETVVEVPPGEVFLVGEHVAAIDSRHLGPVPLRRVMGRYLPLLQLGATDPVELTDADRADLRELRDLRPPVLDRVERVIRAGSCPPAHLALALRRAWVEAARPERAIAVLERSWERDAAVPEDRALWARLLAEHLEATPERALAAAERELAVGELTAQTPLLRQWEATMLARLGRWEEALTAAARGGPDEYVAVRISALLGLGRLEEARAAIARGGWADPSHEPYYRALLAAREGREDDAVAGLVEATRRGFTDPELLRSTPHLEALRGTGRWAEVEAALAGPDG